MSAGPEAIAALSPERRLALERDLLARRAGRIGRPVIAPRDPDAAVPLSAAQRGLWFLNRLDPQSTVHNVHRVMRIRGPLDTAALAASIGDVWSRHEALRSRFPVDAGRPRVAIMPAGPLPLRRVAVTPGDGADTRLRALLEAELRQPFDLAAGPLMRALLATLGDGDHVLALTLHHIACDEWSMRILAEELAACYGARSAGGAPSLPPLAIQYPDFALWQQRELARGRWSAQRDWWRDHLAGAPETAAVAGRAPAPPAGRGPSGRHRWRIPDAVVAGLRQLGRDADATPFMVSLAAFMALLHRYNDGADVVITTPIAGRPTPETERLIGFFANTLALRSTAADDPTFRVLLRRVRATVLGAFENQALPFEAVVDAVRPARAGGAAPLFDILFTHRDAIDPPLTAPQLDIEPIEVRGGAANCDLWLALIDGPDGRWATLDYDRATFGAAAIARIAGHLDRLVSGVLADPDAPLSALPLLGDDERRTLLDDWSGVARCRPVAATIASLFAAQAAQRPDAPAVAGDGGAVDYRTLDAWSNRLAHRLRALGVSPGAVVGIAAARGPALIAGLLGILKAGGAYLALDPAWPAAHLRTMVAAADAALVLATPGLLPDDLGVAVAGLDPVGAGLEREPADAPRDMTGPDSLAYVAFTSGSTGEPKAIAVAQRGVVRLVHAADYVRLGPDERILQMAPLAFDASTFEIWGALLNGGCLVPAPESPTLSEIAGVIARHGVTTAWLTAGLFHRMVDHEAAALAGLRQLLAGGDVLSVDHVRRLRRAAPGLRLINGYGPTETTTFACTWTATDDDALDPSVPIGRPIGNTTVYVVDRHGNLAPIGVPGELWIGGAGVALGYVGRPDLTAERFAADPFGAAPGARVYRTGDRAMWRDDGVLLFLGRADRQVKLRGHRVEPAEIEAALRALPGVREAAVVALPDPAGDRRLVAGCVLDDGCDTAAVTAALRGRLPPHLVPAAVVALDALPLTAAGKLDAAALAARIAMPDAAPGGAPPRDDLERWLAGIWRDVLQVATVGRDDDFFALGGHSLLAAELFAHIDDELDAPLPLATLFAAPTVAGLAAAIRAGRGATAWPTAVPIARGAAERSPLFAVPGIGGNIVGYSALARCLGGDRTFVGLVARGLDGISAPHDRIADIAADNVAQIRAIQPAGPYLILGACIGGVVAFEMAQQLRRAGETVAALVLLDPAFRAPRADAWRIRMRHRLARTVELPRFAARRARLYAGDLGRLPAAQWPGYLRGKAATIGGAAAAGRLPGAAQRELHQQRVIDAHRAALETYVPAPYDGPITIFRSGGRDWRAARRLLDWQALAPGRVAVETVAGRDSADALRPPHVDGFAARLRALCEPAP